MLQALEIRQNVLPSNHSDLAQSYNNVGWLCRCVGNCSEAISYFERALKIYRNSLPANHSNIKAVERSIELVKNPTLLERILLP